MASSVAVTDQPFHVRSISMPSTSHPIALKVEEQLQKLRACALISSTSSSTPQMMLDRLQGLRDLYDCIEELLRLPCNQKALSHPHQRKWVESELDGSVRLLDLCDASRDNLAAAKEYVQGLQFALRRDDAAVESNAHAYIQSRKKAEKWIKNCFRSLKQIDTKRGSHPTFDDKDCDLLLAVIKVSMEAREITISLLQSVSSFLSMPSPRQKASGRWSFVSKALQKRKVAHGDVSEVGSLVVSIYASNKPISCKDAVDGRMQKLQCQLQASEASIEGLRIGLECLFRRLIRNRVSLLNILSL